MKRSLFRLPSDATLREKWRRAIPRKEVGGFSSNWPNMWACEKHCSPADIVQHDELIVDGDGVLL